jgi:metal-dependent amidase/aminoacylase/carboxypeptidase family protein
VVLGQHVMPGPAGVESHRAGTKENVIPAEATIKLNVRAFDQDVREKVLGAIERIVETEAEASDALKSPEITPIDRYPLTVKTPTPLGGSPEPSGTTSTTTASRSSLRRSPPARTPAPSAPNGTLLDVLVHRRYGPGRLR